MPSSNDDHAPDAAGHLEDLFTTIRNGFAPNASPEVKTHGAQACRVILRGLEPMPSQGAPVSSPAETFAGAFTGTPIGEAIKALGAMPREQVMQYVKYGMQSLFSQSAPMYRQKPSPSSRGPGGEP